MGVTIAFTTDGRAMAFMASLDGNDRTRILTRMGGATGRTRVERMRILLLGLVVLVFGCGGSPTGPTPALPRGTLSPWAESMVRRAPSGVIQRWAGGPFRHCLGPNVDSATVQRAALMMSEATGIPQTDTGPCNVNWSIGEVPSGYAAFTWVSGTDERILGATIRLYHPSAVIMARHEVGHALGLQHSSRPGDLMYGSSPGGEQGFSPEEMELLMSIYGR